jgi:Ca-activated chloride channel family protein
MKFTLAQPWFLLLLALLPLAAWLLGRPGRPAAFLYSSVQLVGTLAGASRSRAGGILAAWRWLILALLIVALARPQLTQSETSIKASGIDIALAIDLSGSMESEDFELNRERVNRLQIAKDVLKKFIDRRPGDRMGLIAFAGKAYIAAPLTLDHSFLIQNLERLDLHTIEEGTAIGAGLSAAVNRLRELKSKSKIVILMTDGQNTAGKIPPRTAAEAAQALQIKVYTVGVGTQGMAPFPRGYDLFGRKLYVQVPVDIDEKTLKEIASLTGGKYFRADSSDTLRRIYDEIDRLEKTEVEVKRFVQVKELFAWLAGPALALLLAEIVLAQTFWRRLP